MSEVEDEEKMKLQVRKKSNFFGEDWSEVKIQVWCENEVKKPDFIAKN